MKKVLFISVLALCTTTMNAQIDSVATINGSVECTHYLSVEVLYSSQYGEYIYSFDETSATLKIYEDNFKVSKDINITNLGSYNHVEAMYVSKNLFTNDDKICFIVEATYGEISTGYRKIWIYNEDGDIVKDFKKKFPASTFGFDCFVLNGANYLGLFLQESDRYVEIYSLPNTSLGNEDVSAPVRKSNARKLLTRDQVLIEQNGKTYNAQGAIVE